MGRQTCSVPRPRRDIFDKYIDTLADTDILRLDDRYRCAVANKGVAEQGNKRTSEQGVPHVPNVPDVPDVPSVPNVLHVPDVRCVRGEGDERDERDDRKVGYHRNLPAVSVVSALSLIAS